MDCRSELLHDGGFLTELQARGAHGLIREHGMLRYRPLEALCEIGVDDKGEQIGEQWVQLGLEADEQALRVRRIRIRLPKPTRDGDDTICLVTTLSAEQADALTLAALYHKRCTKARAGELLHRGHQCGLPADRRRRRRRTS